MRETFTYELSVNDVTYLQLFIAKNITFDNVQSVVADYNGDGIINIEDVTAIQMALLK